MGSALCDCSGSPLAVPTRAQTEHELVSDFHAAIAAGRDAEAMDLSCRIDRRAFRCGSPEFRAMKDLWHRRYGEAFKPPSNADALSFTTWEEAGPPGGPPSGT